MEVIRHTGEVRRACASVRASERSIGFVPTMGFFHEGHLELMRAARSERDHVVVSIFVNPLQFGPSEDFESYPRDLDRDVELAEKEGVDTVFAPDVPELYPDGELQATVDPGPLGERLEGERRPGHFRGVCTVLARLFHLVGPSHAYFGQKDAQQVAVVRRMVRDLAFPVEVVACPTVREADGLAMSSRNAYLSASERRAAVCVPEALGAGIGSVRRGEREAPRVLAAMRARIEREALAELDYVAVVDDGTFQELDRLTGPSRALIAARIGRARLIDNMALPVGQNGPEEVSA